MPNSSPSIQRVNPWIRYLCRARWIVVAEWLLMLGLTALLVGPPPLANEPHYMTQAKDAWDETWLPGDLFLDSKDAHVVFYGSVGWLTRIFSLTNATWIARFVGWGLLSAGWLRMVRSLVKLPLLATLSYIAFEALIFRFELAGEWVVGGVEAKVFAFGFVFLATGIMMQLARKHGSLRVKPMRWFWVGPLLGIASAFHVLVGGWSTLCSLPIIALHTRDKRSRLLALAGLIVGGIIALVGVMPGLQLGEGSTPEEMSQGTKLHVFYRLAHHQCFATFDSEHRIRFAALSAVLFLLMLATWKVRSLRPLHLLACGSLLLTLCGILIESICANDRDTAANLLRFYWYRMSDAFVPADVALSSIVITRRILRWNRVTGIVLSVVLAVLVAGHYTRAVSHRLSHPHTSNGLMLLPKRKEMADSAAVINDWKQMCAWVKEQTPSDARFLTPRRQQTFKWFAERGEVVSWKDIPQNGSAVVEWKRRMDEIFPSEILKQGLAAHGEKRLLELAEKYDADYVVLDRTRKVNALPWKQVYPPAQGRNPNHASYYSVYEIPRRQSH
jgi:hypothetical protein